MNIQIHTDLTVSMCRGHHLSFIIRDLPNDARQDAFALKPQVLSKSRHLLLIQTVSIDEFLFS